MADKPKQGEPEGAKAPHLGDLIELLIEGFVAVHQKIHRGQLPARGDQEAVSTFVARLRAMRHLEFGE
jgi:hypothetical protein